MGDQDSVVLMITLCKKYSHCGTLPHMYRWCGREHVNSWDDCWREVLVLCDVNCTGNESNIFDCSHSLSNDCRVSSREEAGVICGGADYNNI